MAELGGRTIAFLEARRAAELGDLVKRHNGVPFAAPCLQEIHQADAPQLRAAVQQLCKPSVGWVIFLTGVGASTLFEAALGLGLEQTFKDALSQKQVVVRGPKPAAALRKLGVRIDVAALAPYTTAELRQALADVDLQGSTVAVQLYGGPNPELRAWLESKGATVLEVAPYSWAPPQDDAPVVGLLDALDSRRVAALAVPGAIQVEHLLGIARRYGRETTLRASLERVPIAAQGPVCEAALVNQGLHASLVPPHGHMGALVLGLADLFNAATPPIQDARQHITPGSHAT